MKNIMLLLLIPMSLVMCAFAQKENDKFEESVKVVAKLTAYDFLESQSNISNAPSQYTLIFEILSPLKLRQKSKYIKAVYRSFGTENANNLIFSNAEKVKRLKLSKQNDCDMSMMEMESKGSNFTDSGEISNTDTSKLKVVGLTYFSSVSDNEKEVVLPCFNLDKVIR